jgi:tripartite-type tricarboxylate transporter receptor subunit TctC
MNAKRQLSRRMLLALGAWSAMGHALSQIAPSRAGVTKIIVGFPPGQATDIVARLLAAQLNTVTSTNYIVENRPGQGGSIAMGNLAKASNDGSMMMLSHMSAVATNPHLYKSVPYDSLRDFEAVGLVGDLPFVLVSHPSLPFTDVKGLVDYAKRHPGKLMNASSGNGTVSHLAMEEFKRRLGLDIVHVPYKGSGPGLTDVVAGAVPIALETAASVQSFVQDGRLRALGSASPSRLGGALSVPTLDEQGFTGFHASTWLMMLYPAGTSKGLVNSTYGAIRRAMGTPEMQRRLLAMGVLPRQSTSPAEAQAYIAAEYKNWGEVVRRSGVKLD